MNKATAVYIRVSTQDQRHDSQVRELKEFCRLRRWSNTVQYIEKESGAKASRPQLDQMMNDMRAGRVERTPWAYPSKETP